MNFKRKKSKRSVKCTLCTPHRWMGNGKSRKTNKEKDLEKNQKREMKKYTAR